MLNRVTLIGHLGQDPDMKYSQDGAPICNLSVATNESYTDHNGNKVERTEWHRVVAFQRQAETCGQFLRKGSLVYVEGSLQTRKWQDKQGQDRYTTEIRAQRVLFLDKRGSNNNGGGQGGDSGQGGRYNGQGGRYNDGQGGRYNSGQGGRYNGQGGRRYDGGQGDYDGQGGRYNDGQDGYNGQGGRYAGGQSGEDYGPAFPSEASKGSPLPSEASKLDDVPF